MGVLVPTDIHGTLDALLVNGDEDAGIESARIERARVTYAGIEGDCHTGLTRKACVRVRRQYAKNTEIRNTRQFSIVSVAELDEVATKMKLPGAIEPEWLGANLLLNGIPDLTRLPSGTRLIFDGGVALVVDTENQPCKYPAAVIDRHHTGFGKRFVRAAKHLRGVTAWVEREGELVRGEHCRVHLPPMHPYPHAAG